MSVDKATDVMAGPSLALVKHQLQLRFLRIGIVSQDELDCFTIGCVDTSSDRKHLYVKPG